MSVASKLARLEKKANDAGLRECRHCLWGYLRIGPVDQVDTGDRRHGYEPVVINEWTDWGPDGVTTHTRGPLSDEDKARTVGWTEDGSWKPEDLRCRWCGGEVSVMTLLALPPDLEETPPASLNKPGERAYDDLSPALVAGSVTQRPDGNSE